MVQEHLKFYSCLRLRFPDVETNPGPRRPVAASWRILCSKVRGLSGSQMVSDLRHMSELLAPGFGRPVLLCRGKLPRARGMAAYVRDGYEAFRQPKFECGCCEMLVVSVCGLRQNFYVYGLYRILTKMTAYMTVC